VRATCSPGMGRRSCGAVRMRRSKQLFAVIRVCACLGGGAVALSSTRRASGVTRSCCFRRRSLRPSTGSGPGQPGRSWEVTTQAEFVRCRNDRCRADRDIANRRFRRFDPQSFRWAFLVQYAVWTVGLVGMFRCFRRLQRVSTHDSVLEVSRPVPERDRCRRRRTGRELIPTGFARICDRVLGRRPPAGR